MHADLSTIAGFFSMLVGRFPTPEAAYEHYRIPPTVYRKMRSGKLRPPPELLAQWEQEFPILSGSKALAMMRDAPMPVRLQIRQDRRLSGTSLDEACKLAGIARNTWLAVERTSCPEFLPSPDNSRRTFKLTKTAEKSSGKKPLKSKLVEALARTIPTNLVPLPQQLLSAAQSLGESYDQGSLNDIHKLKFLTSEFQKLLDQLESGAPGADEDTGTAAHNAAIAVMAAWTVVWKSEVYDIDYYSKIRDSMFRARTHSLRDAAASAGITHAFLRKIEQGERPLPSGPSLYAIATTAGFNEREIFDLMASRLIDPREAIGLSIQETMLLGAVQDSGIDAVHLPSPLFPQNKANSRINIIGSLDNNVLEFGGHPPPTLSDITTPNISTSPLPDETSEAKATCPSGAPHRPNAQPEHVPEDYPDPRDLPILLDLDDPVEHYKEDDSKPPLPIELEN